MSYICYDVSSINLFNVTGDKYGFLIILIGLSFVQSMTKVRYLYFIKRTLKNNLFYNNLTYCFDEPHNAFEVNFI